MAEKISYPNAVGIHVASHFGLLLLSNATGHFSSVPGASTVKVNVPVGTAAFTEGAKYLVGGTLVESHELFGIPNAVFKGYGTGTEAHVATFVGEIVAPTKTK